MDATPDRIFVREVGGGQATYSSFYAAARAWADVFAGLQLGRDDKVAVMYPTSIETSAIWVGALLRRCWYVGVHPELRGQWLAHVVRHSDATCLVVAERFLERLQALDEELPDLRTVVVADAADPPRIPRRWRVVGRGEAVRGGLPVDADPPQRHDVAGLIYTSGTTGAPKGVIVPLGQISMAYERVADLSTDDCVYGPWSMAHLSGLVTIASAIIGGWSVVLRERLEVAEFWADVHTFSITYAVVVPAVAAWLLQAPAAPGEAENTLRQVAISPIIPQVGEFSRRFGVSARTSYGLTEVAGPFASRDRALSTHKGGCGSLVQGFDVRLVDEHDYEVADGAAGELVLRAHDPWTHAVGYYKDPELTAACFRNGWFHTGDVFVRDEHDHYHFVDRHKDALRRRGENISSFQVESIVLQHPHVSECAVIGVPADVPGEQEVKVCVVPRRGADLQPPALHEYLLKRLPRFMVPRYVEVMDTLPRTPATHRVQKAILRQEWRTPATWDRKSTLLPLEAPHAPRTC